MVEKRYIEDERAIDDLVKLAEQKWGRGEAIFLVSALDGARAFYQTRVEDDGDNAVRKASEKEELHRVFCERLVRTFGGDVLINDQVGGRTWSNGRKPAELPCDVVVGRFEEAELDSVVCVAQKIRSRMLEHNLTADQGLHWIDQIHPRIAVARNLLAAFDVLSHVLRDSIMCRSEDWSQDFAPAIQRLLRAAGVAPAPSVDQVRRLDHAVDELIATLPNNGVVSFSRRPARITA